jgi:hypothetical protein
MVAMLKGNNFLLFRTPSVLPVLRRQFQRDFHGR